MFAFYNYCEFVGIYMVYMLFATSLVIVLPPASLIKSAGDSFPYTETLFFLSQNWHDFYSTVTYKQSLFREVFFLAQPTNITYFQSGHKWISLQNQRRNAASDDRHMMINTQVVGEILNFYIPINTLMLCNTRGSCYVINCTVDQLGMSRTFGTKVTSANKSMLTKKKTR